MWHAFKVFTVGISWLLAMLFFVVAIYLGTHGFIFAGGLILFFGVGLWCFSRALEQDLVRESGDNDDNDQNPTTTVYKFA
jgi:hypothetical protein